MKVLGGGPGGFGGSWEGLGGLPGDSGGPGGSLTPAPSSGLRRSDRDEYQKEVSGEGVSIPPKNPKEALKPPEITPKRPLCAPSPAL